MSTEQPEWASYARERHDAEKATGWRYSKPGQWGTDGEWHEAEPEDLR